MRIIIIIIVDIYTNIHDILFKKENEKINLKRVFKKKSNT